MSNNKNYNQKIKRISLSILQHVLLTSIAIIWSYPFLWMVSTSFKSNSEVFGSGLNLIPSNPSWDNVIRVWQKSNFNLYFLNSVVVTVSVVAIVLVTTALAGYVLGRYDFTGKKIIYGVFLSSITIPLVFTIIPVYEMINKLGLVGTRTGLILAQAGGGHVIFLLLFSGFFQQIPKEMEEAADIDGCGFLKKFTSIMLPLAKPIVVTVIIMESMWSWNAFLQPLVLTLNNPSARTLAVGLYSFRGENIVDWTGIAAGATIGVIPIISVFILLQKYFIDGIAGAVKN